MSWGAYIDTITASPDVSQAAIVGLDGSTWAASPGLNVGVDEVRMLISGLKNPDCLTSGGIRISGQKYFYIRSDTDQIQAKKGPNGVSIAKTKQALIIGLYGEGMQGGCCRNVVENMKDYLVNLSY